MKTPLLARSSAIFVGASVAMLWGCLPPPFEPDDDFEPATLEGMVTDDDGYQAMIFGGEGTVSEATAVRAYWRTAFGEFEKVGTDADLERDGSYVITVPADVENIVLKALDDEGVTVAAVIVERTPREDARAVVNPMNTETSVEAAVFENLHERGESDEIDTIDLQNRITTDLAVALRDAGENDEELAFGREIAVLADAIWSAQQAELHLYTELGVFTTSEEMFDIGLFAKEELDEKLHEGEATEQDLETYYHDLHQAYLNELELSFEAAALAEHAASAAFRGVAVPGLADPALVNAALGAAALHEARLLHGGVIDVLRDEGASDAVIEATTLAGQQMMESIAEGTTRSEFEGAFREFGDRMRGTDLTMSNSILENYLDIESDEADAVAAVVEQVEDLTQNLDENLEETQRAFIQNDSGRAINLFSWYVVIASVYDEFYDDIEDVGDPLVELYVDRGDAATRILALTSGAFRGGF